MQKSSLHYKYLKNKWLKRHEKAKVKLWEKHGDVLDWLRQSTKQFMVGSAASLLLLTTPVSSTVFSQITGNHDVLAEQNVPKKDKMIVALQGILPDTVTPLSDEQEKNVGEVLTEAFDIPTSAVLDEKRLNRSYGLIGKEQHLMRYPGDSIATHFNSPEDAVFADSGMAPGRGAWGYWADSSASLTEEQSQQEKYYIAVQTFLAPGWQGNAQELYHFFKYRKMLVVNPENGKAIIAVIGDAGPGESTGKNLGGSPEVMSYLERVDGAQRGPVLYFFIDDPDNKVPLGPIQVK